MKKLLSLFLAMIFVLFTFAGCNPAPAETTTEETEEEIEEITGKYVDGTLVGFSVSDPATLIKMLTGSDSAPDIKDIYYEMGADAEGKYTVMSLGAKLFGTAYDADIFLGEDIIVDAPKILDKAYGIGAEELVNLLKSYYDLSIPGQMQTQNGIVAAPMSTGGITVVGPSASLTPEYDAPATRPADPSMEEGTPAWITMLLTPDNMTLVADLVSKHYGSFVDSLATSGGLAKTEDDKKVTYKGTITGDNLAVILVDALERLFEDDDFFSLLQQFGAPSKDELLKEKPSRAQMIEDIKPRLAPFGININFDMSFDKTTKLPVASGTSFKFNIGSEVKGDFKFDFEAGTVDISVKLDDNNYVDVEIKDGNMKYDLSFNMIVGEDDADYSNQSATGIKMYYEFSDRGLVMQFSNTIDLDQKTPNSSYSYHSEQAMEFSLTKSEKGFNLYAKSIKKAEDSRGNKEDQSAVFTGALEILENGLKITVEADSAKMEAALTIGESDIVGYVTVNGQKLGELKFAKTVDGTKTTIALSSFEMNGVTMDFSAIGIKLYYDATGKVPEAPEYTSISEFTAEDYQKLGETIMNKNKELLEKLAEIELPFGAKNEEATRPAERPVDKPNFAVDSHPGMDMPEEQETLG